MSGLERSAGFNLNTQKSESVTGKAATDPLPLKTQDGKPAAVLYFESQIPAERKSIRYSVIFSGPSSKFVLDSIRQGQKMTVHGFLVKKGMQVIVANQLELDDGSIDIRRKPLTKPWFAINMPNPDLTK